jgi:hypothetical protein
MAAPQPSTPGQRAAEDAFWASVPGRAVRAFEQGEQFFSYEERYLPSTHPVTPAGTQGRSRTDVLAQIESAGWRLQHANWVNHEGGSILGIHLFRRDDTRADRLTGPAYDPPKPARTVLRLHTE